MGWGFVAGMSEWFEFVQTLSQKLPELTLDTQNRFFVLVNLQTIVARIKVYTS